MDMEGLSCQTLFQLIFWKKMDWVALEFQGEKKGYSCPGKNEFIGSQLLHRELKSISVEKAIQQNFVI